MTKQVPEDTHQDATSASPESGAALEEVVSTAEAAAILFVSRQHIVKLIDAGMLPLHHVSGGQRFVRKADALAYKEKKLVEAEAWLASQSEDKAPPGT